MVFKSSSTSLPHFESDASDARQQEFAELLLSSYAAIQRAAVLCVGNISDAEEVVQETCVTLWKKFDDFDPEKANFTRWACGIAHNLGRNYCRKRRRHRTFGLSDEALANVARVQTGSAELLELRRDQLRRCMRRLSKADRQQIWDFYDGDVRIVDLARKAKVSTDSIYSKFARIRRKLYDCVNQNLGRENQ
ncbi:sigma-70 family RNA polymerase sigma factor [Calycomorphotria hydatis]|uniref:ECF RNA polymerase sigma factor RpoE n=1 Tax=Calycomorphotria hydatis TaxID=2528027 RepID=A0A517TCH2_9PLAN|nr:sigma-70 family RNA polymerase sigma factor [Calycomorphotria hydatis]QDT66072.1 ECF RNA polymerase sigma factor RpoE [Calycomorphotria hydatis]